MDPQARPCKVQTHHPHLSSAKLTAERKKKGSGLTEVALGVDEEVVGAEPGHVGGAHVGIVPLQLLVPLLLLLRQVAGCAHELVEESSLRVHGGEGGGAVEKP